jgi:uncharacterized cupin superfamily protein
VSAPNLLRATEIAARAETFGHPWNERSQVTYADLAQMAGMKRTGVNLCRIAPGKESFVEHAHHCEEEWAYILSGRAVARIDGVDREVGPGDFLGFPTPSPAHHLRNPFDQEVVYLTGGENRDVEVVDFPSLGRRTVRLGDTRTVYDQAAGKPFQY